MLHEKIIVVTGGAGRIGRSVVREIAMQRGFAIIADVDGASGEIFASEINRDFPESADFVYLDITSKTSVCELIAVLKNRFGHIHAVINNAYPRNANYGRKLEDVTYEDFCDNVNTHLGGYFLVAQQFCHFFKQQGYGNLINIASIYGVMPPRFDIYQGTTMTMPVEYAAIKSAVIQLTRYFAEYFKKDNIRVNCLSPGGILAGQPESFLKAYNQHCMSKGMLNPDDLTGALLFLLSDQSRHVTGQNIIVDDGFSL